MNRLHALYDQAGQSPWLDNLRRGWITSGQLGEWVDRGVRGITSNPTIFQKAIGESSDYDQQLRELPRLLSTEEAYEALAITDIQRACDELRPV